MNTDPEHPRCDVCREPEPCDCWFICEMCGLKGTRDDEQPCRGERCYEVKLMTLTQACQHGRALLRKARVCYRRQPITFGPPPIGMPDMTYIGPLMLPPPGTRIDYAVWEDGWMKLMLATAPVKGSA